MALTAAEKVSIKRHLGLNSASEALYPWVPTFYSVNRVLDTLPAAAETEARTILARLTDIETRLSSALDRFKASVVGSIKLNAEEVSRLRSEMRLWRRELSTLLGVPLLQSAAAIQVV